MYVESCYNINTVETDVYKQPTEILNTRCSEIHSTHKNTGIHTVIKLCSFYNRRHLYESIEFPILKYLRCKRKKYILCGKPRSKLPKFSKV